MLCGVAAEHGNDILCPRCRYNLRGLTSPRCPECGLAFSGEQWESGVLREHVPTWLDACDPWQPHQVLVRSLYELLRGALRPRWLVTKLDLNGPLVPAGLMLVVGGLWLYGIVLVLLAVAICLHTGASPAASLRFAAWYWSPRVLAVAAAMSVLMLGGVIQPSVAALRHPTFRQYFRLAGYWIPCIGAHVVIPLALLLGVPELVLPVPQIIPVLSGLPALGAIIRVMWRQRRLTKAAPSTMVQRMALLVCLGGWVVLAWWLGRLIVPTSLEPPLGAYFCG
jgi:hypothetical protein